MIYLRGVSHKDLELILTFVYTGQVTFEQERLSEFLKAAKDLKTEMLPLDSEKLFNPKDPKKRKVQCPTCLKIYNNKTKLKIHRENKHEGVRWPCDQCDKQFREKSVLQKHIKGVHEGVRFNCKLCDFEAPYQSSLLSHMKNHNKDKI